MKQLFTFLFLAISAVVFSQAPQSIPYQAVVRNTDGSNMANAAVTITFKIHDNSATGTVVYEETHTTTTNAQGLVSLNVGGGVAVTGTFSGIQWGTGSKFLHVLMNAGNGVVDLGTQQMVSVPYALYAEEVPVRVSVTGDSLFIGDQVSIVPGVSAANSLYQPGNGVTDIDGNFYPSIIINGQEWMQKNLAVSKYRNGDMIQTGLNNNQWGSIYSGAYSVYSDFLYNSSIYGNLYNWYAVADVRGLCPIGWRAPSKADWQVLSNFLGGNTVAGGKMKTTTLWNSPNVGANNESGFTALPAGTRYWNYSGLGSITSWWSSTPEASSAAFVFSTLTETGELGESIHSRDAGFSIRCIKD